MRKNKIKLANRKPGGGGQNLYKIRLNSGFTLIELLGVLIILAVIALITFPIIDNSIKSSREKSLERTIDAIEEAAYRYSIENDIGYPSEQQALYLNEIQSKGFLSSSIINPVTNEELSGCVWYYWDTNYNQYVFEYDMECVQTDTEPVINIAYDESLINSNGWAKENIAVTLNGNGEIKYCISSSECEPNEIVETGNNTKFITTEGTSYLCALTSNSLGSSDTLCQSFQLDKTLPIAGTATFTGTLGSNDWYTTNVTINVTDGSDNLSGHSSTISNIASITSNTTGTTVRITTNDLAGNSTSRDYLIKVDKDSPILTVKDGTVEITEGDSNVVSNYFNVSYSISGGSMLCTPSNTSSLDAGTQTLSCTATGGNGLTTTASKQITVKPNLPESISFATDSWETIAEMVKAGAAEEIYNVGDTKEVEVSGYGTFTVRIANMSTPTECSGSGFSQTACGFVVEFVDIITEHGMNSSQTNNGGWPASSMYNFVNNDIYNALPAELKDVIIDTYVVSSHGSDESSNFISTDKLYLFATKEIWGKEGTSSIINYDTSDNYTRQLDYYNNIGVTTNNRTGAIKAYNGSNISWWLRSSNTNGNYLFYTVHNTGGWSGYYADDNDGGVAPAFRIG